MAWSSLQELQAKRPECSLPHRVPATHREAREAAEEEAEAEAATSQVGIKLKMEMY